MDRRFKSSDWLIVVGALLLLTASLQPWWTPRFDGAPRLSLNAYDFRLTGTVPTVVLLALAVASVIVKTDSLSLPDWLVHPYVVSVGVAGTALLIGTRFVWSGFDEASNASRGLGLYLAAAGVVIAVIGCVVAIRELRNPSPDVDDDDELGEEFGEYDYAADAEEDDLVRRFNTTLPSGETPVHRPRNPGQPPRRIPTTRDREPRRRRARPTEPPPVARQRRRPAGPPLP